MGGGAADGRGKLLTCPAEENRTGRIVRHRIAERHPLELPRDRFAGGSGAPLPARLPGGRVRLGRACSSTSPTAIAASRRTCAATRQSSAPGRGRGLPRQAPGGRHRGADRRSSAARSKRWSPTTGAARSPGTSRRSRPERLRRLVIINSPHPATFLRGLQHDPAQQAASAYMNFLCRPDAEALLAENDFAPALAVLHEHGRGRSGAAGRRLADRGGARAVPRGLERRPARRLQLLPRVAAAAADGAATAPS